MRIPGSIELRHVYPRWREELALDNGAVRRTDMSFAQMQLARFSDARAKCSYSVTSTDCWSLIPTVSSSSSYRSAVRPARLAIYHSGRACTLADLNAREWAFHHLSSTAPLRRLSVAYASSRRGARRPSHTLRALIVAGSALTPHESVHGARLPAPRAPPRTRASHVPGASSTRAHSDPRPFRTYALGGRCRDRTSGRCRRQINRQWTSGCLLARSGWRWGSARGVR